VSDQIDAQAALCLLLIGLEPGWPQIGPDVVILIQFSDHDREQTLVVQPDSQFTGWQRFCNSLLDMQ
jgi:hypothetical protein